MSLHIADHPVADRKPRNWPLCHETFYMLNSAEHEIYPAHKRFKMPTIVGILTIISMINTTSERLKARNFFICRYFSYFFEQLKFHAQLS